ncbi:MAG TPA: hypothetical protein ENH41_03340 [Candidatus Omnitrophica bacterium]|nr:hypothetical protein [Candidatus Omnitrophota bacterium]
MIEDKKCKKCGRILSLNRFKLHYDKRRGRSYYMGDCKHCVQEYERQYRKNTPWINAYFAARQRCNDENSVNYHNYGGKGIRCFITKNEIKELWFRDKAYFMKLPSIHRKNNDGNYTIKNCQFLEKGENTKRAHSIPVIQLTKNGEFIKLWGSVTEASRKLNLTQGRISGCALGYKHFLYTGGFKWKYRS